MPVSEFTKLMITQGLKELMDTTSFNEISISDIAKHCKMSRNTFYYHFKDKHDIVNWIFYTEIRPIIGETIEVEQWSITLLSLCLYMQENRKFYISVLKIQGQNSFSECLIDFCQNITEDILNRAQGSESLSSKQIHNLARFYAYGMIGVISVWAKEGMLEDPKPMVIMLEKLLAGKIVNEIISIQ